MFDEVIASGHALLLRLETDTERHRLGLPVSQPIEVVSFNELSSWQRTAAQAVGRTFGPDPSSRFEAIWRLFADEWNRVRGPSEAALRTLRSLISYLSNLQTRLDPANLERTFDWSVPLDPDGPSPEIAEIEAKRWEFHRALVQDAQERPPGTLDPFTTARRIALHPTHASEFFISLTISGHLDRGWFTPEWRELAERVDA